MKVLHVISDIDSRKGGVIRGVVNLALFQNKIYESTDIATINSKNDITIDSDISTLNRFYFSKISFWTIFKFLRKSNYDIIHVHGLWEFFLCSFLLSALLLRNRVVISPHGMLEEWSLKQNMFKKRVALFFYQRFFLNLADVIIGTAEQECLNIKKHTSNNNIYLVGNCLDFSYCELDNKLSDHTKLNSKLKLLFLSRIHHKKGIENLFYAWSNLQTNIRKNWQLIIAGDGEPNYLSFLQKLALDLKINEEIHFVGHITGENKKLLYLQSDIFILPTFSENFGNVIVEAMATGLPVITTDETPWKIINIINAGWCIKVGVDPIYTVLEYALVMKKLDLEKMGQNGKEYVNKFFAPDHIAKELDRIYKGINI